MSGVELKERRKRAQLTGHKRRHYALSPVLKPKVPPADGWQAACICGWESGPFRTMQSVHEAHRKHLQTANPICSSCNTAKPRDQMSKAASHRCKECSRKVIAAWKAANPERYAEAQRRSHLRLVFNMTPEQYDELFAQQGGLCAICRNKPSDSRGYSPNVDHCHDTGVIRGILCNKCNQALGLFGDSLVTLYSAIHYLLKYSRNKIRSVA